jgi:hypothetical protein
MENKGALLTVAVPLIAFKVWFAILLLMYAPTRETMVWVAATHWPLVIILGLMVGPAIAAYRMLRARTRREQLRREEFMLATARPRRVRQPVRFARRAQCSALWETVSRLEGGDWSTRVER